jgi:flagellar hook-basal body complex protein FliE
VIGRVGASSPELAAAAATPAAAAGEASFDFGAELGRALTEAGASERTADDAATRFAAGDPQVGLHEVMIASEKASIAVRYAVTLKNKLIDSYRELMSTPL